MVYNLRKKALLPLQIPDIILPDPGSPEPDFGQDQAMVDMQWEAGGKELYTGKREMVEALGGVEAMRAQFQGVKVNPEGSRELVDTVEDVEKQFSVKPFNLKKFAAIGPIPSHEPGNFQAEQIGMQNEMQDDAALGEGPPWKDHSHFKVWLDNRASSQTIEEELRQIGLAEAKESIESYYSKRQDADNGLLSPEELLDYVNSIYNLIPDVPSLKVQGGEIMTKHKTVNENNTFSEIENEIKKLAKKYGLRKESKSFNLKKTAQHKTLDNTIMWGPQQTRKVDPFLRQPVSDWHIVERNKGFGLVVDDVWNIDYETIWRENIMDKYSRPYRDKNGNWVGGYIQKRFEVDKNIPEANNLQLKPGQRRRPVLPEYGNTESRLQAARAAGEIEGANDKSKPFNWKEASSKKKR